MSTVPITMERIIKTEMQPDGQVFLYYVDENGTTVQGVLANEGEEDGQAQTYTIVEEIDESMVQYEVQQEEEPEQEYQEVQGSPKERWSDEETRRALIFYIDNKETFLNGQTKKQHLWAVACKTMLPSKTPAACDTKMRNLKRKYATIQVEKVVNPNAETSWPFHDLCHQAFGDDSSIDQAETITDEIQEENPLSNNVTIQSDNGVLTISTQKNKNDSPKTDPKVEAMLNLYLKHKRAVPKLSEKWQKIIWQKIALELGDEPEYWHKRFLNFKSHYIRLLDKQRSGHLDTSWPYLGIFEKIFEGDQEFHRKYGLTQMETSNAVTVNDAMVADETVTYETIEVEPINAPCEWYMAELTILVKYCFDSFEEYRDPSIPDEFLWSEIGRLLDKEPKDCEEKYYELKSAHLDQYISGGYTLNKRDPISILFDNIISKEVQRNLAEIEVTKVDIWSTEKVDVLMQFLYDNLDVFKDSVCHYVCWAVLGKKLDESVYNCRQQWNELVSLYKTILNDKKEDPDMQIDWRYTEMFDRIFDFGTDTKLLEELHAKTTTPVIRVQDSYHNGESLMSDDDDDTNVSAKQTNGGSDPKQFKILEYYIKNRDKFPFSAKQRTKSSNWKELAEQIGIAPDQCVNRFRNLEQVYRANVQREMDAPDKPILWPYYSLCKKAFGYRAMKAKLKTKIEPYVTGEWTPKEIKTLINYFGTKYNADQGFDDRINWSEISQILNRSETACRDKFIDLRKSYRQIKTMVNRGGNCRVTWKYYKLFDAIYSKETAGHEREKKEDKNSIDAHNAQDNSMEEEVVMTAEDVNSIEEEANLQLPEQVEDSTVTEEINPEDVQDSYIQEVEEEHLHLSPEMEVDGADDENVATPSENDESMQSQEEEDYQCIFVVPESSDTDSKKTENAPKIKEHSSAAWTERSKMALLEAYYNNITANKGQVIDHSEMWCKIAKDVGAKSKISARLMYSSLNRKFLELKQSNDQETLDEYPFTKLMQKIYDFENASEPQTKVFKEKDSYSDVEVPVWILEKGLQYYLKHIEEFVHPKYNKDYLWHELCKSANLTTVRMSENKIFNKINYLKQAFNAGNKNIACADLVKQIVEREWYLRVSLETEPKPKAHDENTEVAWTDDQIELLLRSYLDNLDKFKNPKYVSSYLWLEISKILLISPVACSKKMSMIRKEYSTMVKENSENLRTWKFYSLCEKIYGTGKNNTSMNEDDD